MLSTQEILALRLLPGSTAASIISLIESHRTLDELLALSQERLRSFGLKKKALLHIRKIEAYLLRAQKQIERAKETGDTVLTYADEDYPELLKEIYSPPIVVFVRGQMNAHDTTGIAIVGTRTASTYGKLCAERYAEYFARAGTTVVSGMARGIDSYAHSATIRNGGRTIAVIASGLDRIQPRVSSMLAEKISAHGAIVTEYPFGTNALPSYFPQRNRIISGLTKGTIVVESDLKGGGMITARFAFDQNREVFAIPGQISSPKSNGTNQLIRTDRARLTQSPEDVLDMLGYPIPRQDSRPTSFTLNLFEEQVYNVFEKEPIHIDEISEQSSLAPHETLAALLGLECKGLVRQMAGRLFLRV